jgi:hypothetical protein
MARMARNSARDQETETSPYSWSRRRRRSRRQQEGKRERGQHSGVIQRRTVRSDESSFYLVHIISVLEYARLTDVLKIGFQNGVSVLPHTADRGEYKIAAYPSAILQNI